MIGLTDDFGQESLATARESKAGPSDRQQREIEYHRDRAAAHVHLAREPVNLSAVTSTRHRWWNAYWVILRKAKNLGLSGKNVLVVGCGFGDDAVQLAYLGASISAVDISPESVAIAQERAHASGVAIDFEVSPAERLPYADETFDVVYLPDVVHHIEISTAMREVRRVLKRDGVVLGNEPYTHSWLQAIRQSRLVRELIYPRMVRRIYGTDKPYITADERKLNQRDLQQIGHTLQLADRQYFLLISGRLATSTFWAIIDRLILMMPLVGYFFAGRLVFCARRRLDDLCRGADPAPLRLSPSNSTAMSRASTSVRNHIEIDHTTE